MYIFQPNRILQLHFSISQLFFNLMQFFSIHPFSIITHNKSNMILVCIGFNCE